MLKTKLFAVLCFIILFLSCKTPGGGTYIDVGIHISLVDQHGQNLFAPTGPITKNDITISYLIDGKEVVYNEPHLDAAKGFRFIDDKTISIMPNTDKKEEFPITIIKFGNFNTDVIKCEVERKRGNAYVSIVKVWHNNVVKYDVKNGLYSQMRAMTIVK